MNSNKFLKLFLLLAVLLIAVAKAQEKEADAEVEVADASKEQEVEETKNSLIAEEPEAEKEKEEVKEPEKEEPKATTAVEEKKPEEKTTTVEKKPTKTATSKPTTQQQKTSKPVQTPESKPATSNNNTVKKPQTSQPAPEKPANKATSENKVNNTPVSETTPATNANTQASPVSPVNNVVPQVNSNAAAAAAPNTSAAPVSSSNVNADGNVENKKEGNGVITTTVISLVAVGAVVGVATVGVNAYKKKTSGNSRAAELADIEAQPINQDFKTDMQPEDYNPYNIMSEPASEPYITNSPYEYKPSFTEEVMTTTPFQKTELAPQDNFMSRESIFSNNGNIPQIGNDVFNFSDPSNLPYVQELPVENAYIEEPVANEIQVENSEISNSQMPTLVPVQPEIVITQPEEEPAQEGYKQIVPTVAQMEIIETPDFNNMTTSMIEDHINNMDLENLANTETQPTETDEGGYKQIVPDIQEAVIENFDIEDDEEEDQDISVVDNITDTYRAALRATYCSTEDDNRFSYRTVDSDHSLLHNMREDGEW